MTLYKPLASRAAIAQANLDSGFAQFVLAAVEAKLNQAINNETGRETARS
jgi:hypothetical protein